MPVACKVGNLPSVFGHARPLVLELFALYATDGRTEGRTDKSNAYCPLPYGLGVIMKTARHSFVDVPRCCHQSFICGFLSASLYVSKRGAY